MVIKSTLGKVTPHQHIPSIYHFTDERAEAESRTERLELGLRSKSGCSISWSSALLCTSVDKITTGKRSEGLLGHPHPSPPRSPGRAARRCPPASRGCRSRSHLWGCRPPHWHRCSSRCSSGPTSRWDTAGCSRGPATLRGRNKAVTSLSRVSTVFCPLPPALYKTMYPNHPFSGSWVEHASHLLSPLGTTAWLLRAQGLEAGSPACWFSLFLL